MNGVLIIPSKDFKKRSPLLIFEGGEKYSTKFKRYLGKHIPEQEVTVEWQQKLKDHVLKRFEVKRPKSQEELKKLFEGQVFEDYLGIYQGALDIK